MENEQTVECTATNHQFNHVPGFFYRTADGKDKFVPTKIYCCKCGKMKEFVSE